MEQEMMIVLTFFIFFLLAGALGTVGIYSVLHHKRKQAIWSFGIGFVLIVIYLVTMFSFGLASL